MCGIALILSGVRIVGCDICREPLGDAPSSPSPDADESTLVMDDLKTALHRRGPDNLGAKKVLLQLECTDSTQVNGNVMHTKKDFHALFVENIDNGLSCTAKDLVFSSQRTVAELNFLGATLQLRGVSPVFQPQVDSSGNLLAYNGEIFEGIYIESDSNDTEALLHVLESCCSCASYGFEKDCFCSKAGLRSIPEILSTIRGPWALIYWHQKTNTLWFGRDPFGRRSLLVHWPTSADSRFALSSVSPASSDLDSGSKLRTNGIEPRSDTESHISSKSGYWEELPCGIYSIELKSSTAVGQVVNEKIVGEVRKHAWTNPLVNRLIKWERTLVDPKVDSQPRLENAASLSTIDMGNHQVLTDLESLGTTIACKSDTNGAIMDNYRHGNNQVAEKILNVLRESVMKRTILRRNSQTLLHKGEKEDDAPIAVLFSGGLDSMILAALLDQCVDSRYAIDLLNVSFDGQLAPDRVSAKAGKIELQKIAPCRRWRLVEIDASLSDLESEAEHVVSLIYPAKTYMDLNIGIALWLAAGGDGWVEGKDHMRHRYKSTARVLLVGSGADEQCGGYGRHRTKFRLGGWAALDKEMRLDVQRIWKRNMGRDDRCISDHGKEARFPFLDENVIEALLDIPLWDIVDLNEPVGRGDKKILRQVAKLLGLKQVATMPKRAIQFGSRIARESNRKNFGSNRAANQASAGSVEIHQAQV